MSLHKPNAIEMLFVLIVGLCFLASIAIVAGAIVFILKPEIIGGWIRTLWQAINAQG